MSKLDALLGGGPASFVSRYSLRALERMTEKELRRLGLTVAQSRKLKAAFALGRALIEEG